MTPVRGERWLHSRLAALENFKSGLDNLVSDNQVWPPQTFHTPKSLLCARVHAWFDRPCQSGIIPNRDENCDELCRTARGNELVFSL